MDRAKMKQSDSIRKSTVYKQLAVSDTESVESLRGQKDLEPSRKGLARQSTRIRTYDGTCGRHTTGPTGTTPVLLKVTRVIESPDSGLGTSSTEETEGPNFDLLFECPDKYPMGFRTPKYLSPSGSLDDQTDTDAETGKSTVCLKDVGRTDSDVQESSSKQEALSRRTLSRDSSLADSSLSQLLLKHIEHSHGFGGFRRRVAIDISLRYCSLCHFDEVIFLFLYVLFGIVYMCAGTLGILNCPDETTIAAFLLIDGMLSIFVFPITVMEWTKRIGGCINQDQKLHRGIFFIIVVLLRMAAAVTGTVILVLRAQEPPEDEPFCFSVHMLLEVGVALEWGFLLLVILLPLGLYLSLFITAKISLRKNLRREETRQSPNMQGMQIYTVV